MKFGYVLTVVAAAATQALAVDDVSHSEPYHSEQLHPVHEGGVGACGLPGGKCVEGKRAASAVADALRTGLHHPHGTNPKGLSAFCSVPGTKGCNEKWAAVERIGAAAERAHAAISAREANADAEAHLRGGLIGFCGTPGSSCKRDAEAHLRGGLIGFCGTPGSSCKRDADPEADPKHRHHRPGPAPKPKKLQFPSHPSMPGGQIGFCGVPGESCKRDGLLPRNPHHHRHKHHKPAPAQKPDHSSPNHLPGGLIGFCGTPGSSCKREADPRRIRGGLIGFCGTPGSSCKAKRNQEVENDPKIGSWPGFCGVEGEVCALDKRDRTGFCGVPGEACAKRDFMPAHPAEFFTHLGYGGVPGEANAGQRTISPDQYKWRDYCSVPGSTCATEKGLEANKKYTPILHVDSEDEAGVEHAQNAIRSLNPEAEYEECHQEGQPCHLIRKAAEAFKAVQAREAHLRGGLIGFCGTPGSSCKREAQLDHLKLHGGSHTAKFHAYNALANETEAKIAEEECHKPHGACTLAARAINELDEAIAEGIAQI
jgi:hypothetical protein